MPESYGFTTTTNEVFQDILYDKEMLQKFDADMIMYRLRYANSRYKDSVKENDRDSYIKFNAAMHHLQSKLDDLILGDLLK